MGRRARLEKLQDNLAKVTDGRKLRSIVREMIRQGGQRVLHRLESTPIPLEPWMCEVLVNCCHLEIRLEEAEKRLRPLQRRALQPLKDEVKKMTNMPKEKRFDRLCTWTWDSIKDNQGPPDKGNPIMESNPWRKPPRLDLGQRDRKATPKADENNLPASLRSGRSCHQADSSDDDQPPAKPRFAAEEDDVVTAEQELVAIQNLLEDTRQNAASAICNRVRQAEKGSRGGAKEAMAWGHTMLTLMVNEEFAKSATKELRRTHAGLTE